MSAITQDVLFNLGVTGADGTITKIGATTLKFGALAAAAGMASRAIYDTIKQADDLADAIGRSDRDMTRFLITTKGLVSATEAYTGANKLMEARIPTTTAQMDALGKKAMSYADSVGISVPEAFDKLTDAIVKGSSRGLLPFGIVLEETTDKTLAQQEALEKLVAQTKDADDATLSLTESMTGLMNVAGDTTLLVTEGIIDKLGQTFFKTDNFIQSSTSALSQFNQELISSDGALTDYMFSLKGIINTVAGVFVEMQRLLPTTKLFGYIADKLGLDTSWLNTMAENQYDAQGTGRRNRTKEQQGEKAKNAAMSAAAASAENQSALDEINALEAQYDLNAEFGSKKRRGGGGRRNKVQATTVFDQGLSGVDIQDLAMGITTPSEERAAEIAAMQADFQAGQVTAMEQEQALAKWNAEEQVRIEADKYAALNSIQKQHFDASQEYAKMDAIGRAAINANAVSTIGGQLGQLSAMQNRESRKGFETSKNLQIAQASMTMPQAILNAWNTGMQFGPAGIVMAPLLVATTTALAIAQIAQISKMKYGGGKSSSGSSTSLNISTASNNYGAGNASGQGTTIINNVLVDGNVIHQSMIRANDSAAQKGEKSFSTAA